MPASPMDFLRGTIYRWAQIWPEVCPDLRGAPRVLAIGDLHVESFGTWRDITGRLAGGVDDFDEACHLPYIQDLLRLAASARLAVAAESFSIGWKDACDAILEGYREGLRTGGRPFVLEEQNHWLRTIAVARLDDPRPFWEKLLANPPARKPVPRGALQAIKQLLPGPRLRYRIVSRSRRRRELRPSTICRCGGLVRRNARPRGQSSRALGFLLDRAEGVDPSTFVTRTR